jgi:nitrite reductase/ring-hydroxylating ferredoxin subunit
LQQLARDRRLICDSNALLDGGSGVRFELETSEQNASTGFAIRQFGVVHAYVNRCPHAGTELDWQPGEFFDESGLYLICSTHGALFAPGNGYCVGGPCRGASLQRLEVSESEGHIFLLGTET